MIDRIMGTVHLEARTAGPLSCKINVYIFAKATLPGVYNEPMAIDHDRFVGLNLFNNYDSLVRLLALGADSNRDYSYQDYTTRMFFYPVDRGSFAKHVHLTGTNSIHQMIPPRCLQLLIDHGADVNKVNSNGNSSIHYQQDYGSLKMLIESGANINSQNKIGLTALHRQSSHRCMSLLLESGADPNIVDGEGYTPMSSEASVECMVVLLLYGANPQYRRMTWHDQDQLTIDDKKNSALIRLDQIRKSTARIQRWSRSLWIYRTCRLMRTEAFNRWWYDPSNIGGIVAKRQIAACFTIPRN